MSDQSPIEALLASHRNFRAVGRTDLSALEAETARLIDNAGLWPDSTRSASFETHGRVVPVFVDECRPGDAAVDGVWLALIGTLIFFCFDDIPDEQRTEHQMAIRACLADGVDRPGYALFSAFRRALTDFPRGHHVTSSFVELLDGMLEEATVKEAEGFSIANYDGLRQEVVFVRQYQEIWSCGERLTLPPAFDERKRTLDTLAGRIIAAVNDLASVDSEGDRSLNRVQLLVEAGSSLEQAVAQTQEHHAEMARAFVDLVGEARRSFVGNGDVERFLDQCASTIRGNLRASLRLRAERYPRAFERLSACEGCPVYAAGVPHPLVR